MPASGLAIRQEPGANALDTANAIRAKMNELSRYFPHGVKVIYPYDTTPFTKVAIEEVAKTLFEAILLVFLVMYLFMGNMRATLIQLSPCRWCFSARLRCWDCSGSLSTC